MDPASGGNRSLQPGTAFEVSFHLDEEALIKISPYANRDEASLLHVFDVNRARIQETATLIRVRGGRKVIIDCRHRIYCNRSIVEEAIAQGD